MRIPLKTTIAALLAILCVSSARKASAQGAARGGTHQTEDRNLGPKPNSLSPDDRLSVMAAALDSRLRLSSRDCSHLVHSVYERAGFPYLYVSSYDLYAGVEGFERVAQPQAGDLIVWRGHVGIVIRPSRHVFFSYTHTGPGIDDYQAAYWTRRGRPRFYRYLKNDPCAGCVMR